MDKYLKRPADEDVTSVPNAKKTAPNTKTPAANTASLKTVKKWMSDFNIDLDFTVDNNNTVHKIACKTCKDWAPQHMKSNFITGNTTVKRESVQYHAKSLMHIRALEIKTAEKKKANNQPSNLQKGFDRIDIDASDKMGKLFKTSYYIALNEKPFSDFPDLIDLQEENGLSLGDTYRNEKGAKMFIDNIGGVYHDSVLRDLNTADYFSIFCDGSTDRSDNEKEVIFVKVLEDYYPKMKYLKIEEPENTKAEGILAAIDKAFLEFDMQNYKQKTVGFCSDGASVMMGARKGVIKLLKDAGNADWVLPVWCLAHRLELAIKDAFKGSYMDTVIDMLVSIYYFYRGSAKRYKEANDIADLLGEHFMKPEKANGTRWVDHKLRAVAKLIQNWPIIITQMENYSEDASNRAADRAKVRGYLRIIKQHKFVWYLGLVKDILNEVAKISLLFQRDDITVYSAVTKLQSAEGSLRNLCDNDGASVVEIEADIANDQYRGHTIHNIIAHATLAADRKRIVTAVLDCVNVRFANLLDEPVFLACHAFDHKNWPVPTERQALLQYGREDVRIIYKHFSSVLTQAGCNLVNALSQWNDLKCHVSGTARYTGMHPLLVWQLVSQGDQEKGDFRDIMKLIHLTSVLPLSNATCERAFSTMKRIKSDWRCNLSAQTLDTLMRIRVANVAFRDWDPKPAVRRWWFSGDRQKRPNALPYGPRN